MKHQIMSGEEIKHLSRSEDNKPSQREGTELAAGQQSVSY